jgi:hypothetical protein
MIMWVLKFDAPKGCRIMKDIFYGIICYSYVVGENPTVYDQDKVFKLKRPADYERGSSHLHCGINSVRAFTRYLNKYCGDLQHCEFTLVSRYYKVDDRGNNIHDYSVEAIWEDV